MRELKLAEASLVSGGEEPLVLPTVTVTAPRLTTIQDEMAMRGIMDMNEFIYGAGYDAIIGGIHDIAENALCALHHGAVTGHDGDTATYTESEYDIIFGGDDRFVLDEYGHAALSDGYITQIQEDRQTIDEVTFTISTSLGVPGVAYWPAGLLGLVIAATAPPQVNVDESYGAGETACSG